jgi:hypothetical protein
VHEYAEINLDPAKAPLKLTPAFTRIKSLILLLLGAVDDELKATTLLWRAWHLRNDARNDASYGEHGI